MKDRDSLWTLCGACVLVSVGSALAVAWSLSVQKDLERRLSETRKDFAQITLDRAYTAWKLKGISSEKALLEERLRRVEETHGTASQTGGDGQAPTSAVMEMAELYAGTPEEESGKKRALPFAEKAGIATSRIYGTPKVFVDAMFEAVVRWRKSINQK